ncbi:MAG: acyl-CoA thioesterase [Gemmatimonadota bacterium]|nr:acyl-CoA thioesterase [Gemmatimonadota bacterium]
MPDASADVLFHIYPTDCDMLGHLNHATMLGFLERARWALFDHRLTALDIARHPAFPVVRHVDIDYLAPTLPGEDLVVRSGILKIGTTSYTIRQRARKAGTGQVVAEANVVIVAIDRAGNPVPMPDVWKSAVPPWGADG